MCAEPGTAESWSALSFVISGPTSLGFGKPSLEPHLPWLEAQWDTGLRNGAELWRQLRLAGFSGGLRVVTERATRRRRAEKAENGLGHAPAARTVVRLMTLEHNNLTKVQTMTVAAIQERLPDLVEA
ncbi:hypothetical protein [Agrobacterium sp. SORGH_AS 787]|uniref:hypothetical protein n=1 Tax=Agrobacterium sp. SORGH_AS 787 TaxID=3041775 RepID=UPI0027845B55|nr:hypothetical protein [Rhizobium sp. SORGH_AS_0787]